jgi:hypothetical protein
MDLPTLTDPPAARRRRFQYSLRTLFIFSLFIALSCAGFFSEFDFIRALTLYIWLIVYSMMLLAVVIYGHGYLRSFCIGALISIVPVSIILLESLMDISELKIDDRIFHHTADVDDPEFFIPAILLLIILALSVLGGLTVIFTRWMIDSADRRNQQVASPSQPTVNPPTR